ncbi:MAG TPA: metallophosphoesterase [Mucilaginibacter sp.]
MRTAVYFIYIVLWAGIICLPVFSTAQVNKPIIEFASDTQSPLLVERAIRKLDHNEKATEAIFKDVVATHPSGLFLLGDVVSLGYKNSKWKKIDGYLKLCANSAIPVYATLGNHELMLNAAKGRRNFQSRFAMYKASGYSEIIDSVAVILLNSNFSKMTSGEIAQQDNWYNNTLKEMDDDPAIKFIIVGCHHAPFTNSKVVAPSIQVQQNFVPPFIRSKKCVLFLSGHSHNFEQFKAEGKCFLVIGGGGGPHQPLNTKRQLMPDLAATYKPMFHYLEITRNKDSLQVVSRQLKADFWGI